MSVEMRQISFPSLLEQALWEYDHHKTIFGVPVIPAPQPAVRPELFGTRLESVVGPAAGPHTQLAQNLVAAYAGGGRFFELKTVQILWGEQLGIQRPCIYVPDEGYNVEWSTELSPEQAAQEYIKGYLALKLLSKELSLGDPEGFLCNLSVGYDLPGIQSPAVDGFIETMKNAERSPFWQKCIAQAKAQTWKQVDEAYIDSISPCISNSVTISTMHGCPPEQIQAIAAYMLEQKGLNTYIKCNPTLLGYDACRSMLDTLGYTHIQFDHEQFQHDMKAQDAIPMVKTLMETGKRCGLRFGVKLTNTFPVKIQNGELPGDTMYLSGKALFPLSLSTATMLAEATEGKLPVSFSGGADEACVAQLYQAGIYPITVATMLLKPGGYANLSKLSSKCAGVVPENRINALALNALGEHYLMEDSHFRPKAAKKALGQTPPFSCGRCRSCVDVCPNRANFRVEGLDKKVVHLDAPCNDCGACASACPFGFKPFADKFVLFPDPHTLYHSDRDGFTPIEGGYVVRWQGKVNQPWQSLPVEVLAFMEAVGRMKLPEFE